MHEDRFLCELLTVAAAVTRDLVLVNMYQDVNLHSGMLRDLYRDNPVIVWPTTPKPDHYLPKRLDDPWSYGTVIRRGQGVEIDGDHPLEGSYITLPDALRLVRAKAAQHTPPVTAHSRAIARLWLRHRGHELRRWFGTGDDDYEPFSKLRIQAFTTHDNLGRLELARRAFDLLERIQPSVDESSAA
jgi:hypothetical protein